MSGFLILEAIIALGLFSISVFSIITLSEDAKSVFEDARVRNSIIDLLSTILVNPTANDSQFTHASYGNDASIASLSSSTAYGKSTITENFSLLEADTFSAYGKDTCPVRLAIPPAASPPQSALLPISAANTITGLVVKDGTAYISTDSNTSSDPDFFMVDLSNSSAPLIIGSLNTGPGAAALAVADPYAYVANKSTVNQLQILDIHDRTHPILIAQAKVPLDTASATAPLASSIAYEKGFVYLGTEKGPSPELTVWSVADPAHPILAGSYELGNIAEAISVANGRAYVAGADANQLTVFDISDPTRLHVVASSAPSGWQTQSGQAVDNFLGTAVLGRSTGGKNVLTNPELILYDSASDAVVSSFDEPGGVYGIVDRSPLLILLTRRSADQLRIDSPTGTTSLSYTIPGIPAALSCDQGNLYVASNNAASITRITDFHE